MGVLEWYTCYSCFCGLVQEVGGCEAVSIHGGYDFDGSEMVGNST